MGQPRWAPPLISLSTRWPRSLRAASGVLANSPAGRQRPRAATIAVARAMEWALTARRLPRQTVPTLATTIVGSRAVEVGMDSGQFQTPSITSARSTRSSRPERPGRPRRVQRRRGSPHDQSPDAETLVHADERYRPERGRRRLHDQRERCVLGGQHGTVGDRDVLDGLHCDAQDAPGTW
jgi:hypothetical protein